MNQTGFFLAHSANHAGRTETQCEHLSAVALRASGFAASFGQSEVARVTGLLHDLGKYSARFQNRLQGKETGVDHWSSGAWAALMNYHNQGLAPALAIAGHHIGLQQADRDSLRSLAPDVLRAHHPLNLRVPEEDSQVLLVRLEQDGLALPTSLGRCDETGPSASWMLATRFLFSALVDADFLETEAHFEGTPTIPRMYRSEALALAPEDALDHVLTYIESLERDPHVDGRVLALRQDLLRACLAAASSLPGLFTLSAPTGTGKTLAMLSFALKHAALNHLDRIIVVVPYLTIIEQTACAYRRALGLGQQQDYLLEHHSLAGAQGETSNQAQLLSDSEEATERQRRMLAENWDAPLVLTTSVQFLESLFANRPSACRKLHRLAKSVIMFDEVQTLPTRLALPTLAALADLTTARFGSTVMLATATQPAFSHLDQKVRVHSLAGWQPREVVPSDLRLFDRARRVTVAWPDLDKPLSWLQLAEELRQSGSALCVVNLKRHAQALVDLLAPSMPRDSMFHLSTSMCPAHRQRVLDTVRTRLTKREPCLLISTQCIEAGVDVDFPAVFRAFGPLDAIAQAAGRCNRNGTMGMAGSVTVFLSEDDVYPAGGGYRQAAAVTRALLRQRGPEGMDINDPGLFHTYFTQLYDLTRPEDLNQDLLEAIKAKDFAAVAKYYRVIDQDAANVLVPYDPTAWAALREELRRKGALTRDWTRRAAPHSVSVFRAEVRDTPNLQAAPLGKGGFSEDWFIALHEEDYNSVTGFRPRASAFW